MHTPSAAQTIASVRARLPAGSELYWGQSDLVSYYNDALDELSERTEFHERYATVKRRKWATLTDLRGILPEEAIRVTAVWSPATNRWLEPTTVRELDWNLGRGWERNTDLARGWFMRGLWWLGTYPRPGDDVSPLRAYFSAMHPHVVDDGSQGQGLTAVPAIPPDFEVALQDHMLYQAFAEHREPRRALGHWADFVARVADLKALVERRVARDRTARMGARRQW